MRIDAEAVRRHYASLSDEALQAIDRAELVDAAQRIYDQEIDLRRLPLKTGEEDLSDDRWVEVPQPDLNPDELGIDIGPEPDWLNDAASVYSIMLRPGVAVAEDMARARAALRKAGIPCHIVIRPVDDSVDDRLPMQESAVLVPGHLNLHATSILDKEIFNPVAEAMWRSHLDSMPDEEFQALDPEIFCAGLLDRAERLQNAYADELGIMGHAPAR